MGPDPTPTPSGTPSGTPEPAPEPLPDEIADRRIGIVGMGPVGRAIAQRAAAFGAAIATHLLLNWSWIVEVTRRFFGKARWSARVNYVLNTLLFVDMTLIIFTGLMISEAALPLLGIQVSHGGAWRRLHDLTANLGVLLIGLHLALHWHWIVNATKRLIGVPRRVSAANIGSPSARKEARP